MPGVLDSNLDCGLSRVGKMAFFMHPDLHLAPDDLSDLDEMARKFLNPSSSPRDSGDSEGELLPDEPTVDLLKYLDPECHEFEECSGMSRSLLCDAECNQCRSKKKRDIPKGKVSGRDPFMGSTISLHKSPTEMNCGTPSWSILGTVISPLEEQLTNSPSSQDTFSAWGHTSNSDEYQIFTKSSFSSMYPDDDVDDTFPDTPSTFSEHAVTDDSDVDIETVTDAPRSADLYPSSSQGSSPLSSPSLSPTPIQNLQKGSLMSILSRSTSSTSSSSPSSPTSPSSSKSLLRFNSQGVSSSVSLAENLMLGRSHSISGHKRKLQKEKKFSIKTSTSSSTVVQHSPQVPYSHVLVNSNSVNFHDYAMSPGSCLSPSTETGRPTVMSKRMYRKRHLAAMDISDKEKQHHHNQLERNRRQKLADLFTYLRDEIPKIKSHSKASKVVILNDAADYIRDLKRLDVHQENEKEMLIQKQMILTEQLRRLNAQYLRK